MTHQEIISALAALDEQCHADVQRVRAAYATQRQGLREQCAGIGHLWAKKVIPGEVPWATGLKCIVCSDTERTG